MSLLAEVPRGIVWKHLFLPTLTTDLLASPDTCTLPAGGKSVYQTLWYHSTRSIPNFLPNTKLPIRRNQPILCWQDMLTWPLARALLWPQPVWRLQCLWATRWVALGKNWIRDSFWPPVGNQSQSRQNLHRMWLPIFGLWFPVLHTALLPFSIEAGPQYHFCTTLHLPAPAPSCTLWKIARNFPD